jgi:hypothetical protein
VFSSPKWLEKQQRLSLEGLPFKRLAYRSNLCDTTIVDDQCHYCLFLNCQAASLTFMDNYLYNIHSHAVGQMRLSELHLTRLCRTEPVAPALPCAHLVGAASRRRVFRSCGNHFFLHSELSDYTPLYRWRFELTMQYTGSI